MARLALTGALVMAAPAIAAVDFKTEVAPVLEQACVPCHGPEKALGDLRVDRATFLGKSVTPGQPGKSTLYTRTQIAPGKAGAMPPAGPPLTRVQSEALRQWIAEGAAWPAGLALGVTKPRARDDAQLVSRLRERLVASESQPFAAYKQEIPGAGVSYEMVPVPAGEFVMGTPETEAGRRQDEVPQRRVRLDAFWMGKFEITWDEYRLFMFPGDPAGELIDAVSRPTRPYVEMSFGMGINGYPAISMTHHAASKYAQWLSARTGHFYRLPTEAEWEYACRAGTATAYSFGGDAARMGEHAWYAANSGDKYQKVGTRRPNPWGLHDMHGNVVEWVLDQYLPDAYSKPTLPWVRSTRPYRHSVRGGSWNDPAERCRCGARSGSDPTWKLQDPQLPKSIWYHSDAQWVGFRLVRPRRLPPAQEINAYWNSGVEQE